MDYEYKYRKYKAKYENAKKQQEIIQFGGFTVDEIKGAIDGSRDVNALRTYIHESFHTKYTSLPPYGDEYKNLITLVTQLYNEKKKTPADKDSDAKTILLRLNKQLMDKEQEIRAIRDDADARVREIYEAPDILTQNLGKLLGEIMQKDMAIEEGTQGFGTEFTRLQPPDQQWYKTYVQGRPHLNDYALRMIKHNIRNLDISSSSNSEYAEITNVEHNVGDTAELITITGMNMRLELLADPNTITPKKVIQYFNIAFNLGELKGDTFKIIHNNQRYEQNNDVPIKGVARNPMIQVQLQLRDSANTAGAAGEPYDDTF